MTTGGKAVTPRPSNRWHLDEMVMRITLAQRM
jgi:hypothetical protein